MIANSFASGGWRSALRGETGAALGQLLEQLRCRPAAALIGFEHRPDFDFRVYPAQWRAPDPFDRLLDRFHLPQPESADQLLCLGERSIGHGALACTEPDPHAMG